MDLNLSSLYSSLALLFLFIFLNAVFVALEFALVSVRESKVRELVDSKSPNAKCVEHLKKNQTRTIAGAQLGVTLASLAIGWLGEGSIHRLILILVNLIPGVTLEELPAATTIVAAFVVMSSLHVVLGEQLPKVIALKAPLRLLQLLTVPFRVFYLVTLPLIYFLDVLTGLLARISGIGDIEEDSFVSMEEYPHLLLESELGGEMEEEKRQLILRALNFSERRVIQRMVPRNKVDFVPDDISLEQLLIKLAQTKHSRLPVYHHTPDNIIGVLYAKDLFEIWSSRLDCRSCEAAGDISFSISELIKEPFFVPETKDAFDLFEDMRLRRYQMAIVLDEFGCVSGIVTQEDLLEHLVGSIEDEYDEHDMPLIQKTSENKWLVRGETLIEAVNEALECSIHSESGQSTIAGVFIESLEHNPEVGDYTIVDGYRFEVLKMEEFAVRELQVTPCHDAICIQ